VQGPLGNPAILTAPPVLAGTVRKAIFRSPPRPVPKSSPNRMTAHADSFHVPTRGKGTYEVTNAVARIVSASGVQTGTTTVLVAHTSASLVIMENADPTARSDLHAYFEHNVAEDTPYFAHTAEGPDDSTSHIRMVLTGPSHSVPVVGGKLALGTWQGLYLFEHRRQPHTRRVTVSVVGV
jgi:secondary thiamine-phosphate synthase enzyme